MRFALYTIDDDVSVDVWHGHYMPALDINFKEGSLTIFKYHSSRIKWWSMVSIIKCIIYVCLDALVQAPGQLYSILHQM